MHNQRRGQTVSGGVWLSVSIESLIHPDKSRYSILIFVCPLYGTSLYFHFAIFPPAFKALLHFDFEPNVFDLLLHLVLIVLDDRIVMK